MVGVIVIRTGGHWQHYQSRKRLRQNGSLSKVAALAAPISAIDIDKLQKSFGWHSTFKLVILFHFSTILTILILAAVLLLH